MDLAADDQVAARVTTGFLRRPALASKAMADDTAPEACWTRVRCRGRTSAQPSPSGCELTFCQHRGRARRS